jgi:hypothetical protein
MKIKITTIAITGTLALIVLAFIPNMNVFALNNDQRFQPGFRDGCLK